MKKIFLSICTLFLVTVAIAQIENPVKWSYTAKKVSEKVYDIYVTATLEPKWHIYAQEAGEGPEPTTLSFSKNALVTLDGKTTEKGKLQKQYDENFKSVLKFYGSNVSFVQRVKLKSAVSTIVNGTVSYMVCNDNKCLPPKEIPFSVTISGK